MDRRTFVKVLPLTSLPLLTDCSVGEGRKVTGRSVSAGSQGAQSALGEESGRYRPGRSRTGRQAGSRLQSHARHRARFHQDPRD